MIIIDLMLKIISFIFISSVVGKPEILDQMLPSRTPRISSTVARSVRKGQRSVSSVSCGSLNQVETGTAL